MDCTPCLIARNSNAGTYAVSRIPGKNVYFLDTVKNAFEDVLTNIPNAMLFFQFTRGKALFFFLAHIIHYQDAT